MNSRMQMVISLLLFQYDTSNINREFNQNLSSPIHTEEIFNYDLNQVINYLSDLELVENQEQEIENKHSISVGYSQPVVSSMNSLELSNWNINTAEFISVAIGTKFKFGFFKENNLQMYLGVGFETTNMSFESQLFDFSASQDLPIELEDYDGLLKINGEDVVEYIDLKRLKLISIPVLCQIPIAETGWNFEPQIAINAILPSIASSYLKSGNFSYSASLENLNIEIQNNVELGLFDDVSFSNYQTTSIRYYGYGINPSLGLSKSFNNNSSFYINVSYFKVNIYSNLENDIPFSSDLYQYNSQLNGNGLRFQSINCSLGYRIYLK